MQSSLFILIFTLLLSIESLLIVNQVSRGEERLECISQSQWCQVSFITQGVLRCRSSRRLDVLREWARISPVVGVRE